MSNIASKEIRCSNLHMKKILARIPLTYLVRVNLSNFTSKWFKKQLRSRLQRFQFNWVQIGCSHSRNTVSVQQVPGHVDSDVSLPTTYSWLVSADTVKMF